MKQKFKKGTHFDKVIEDCESIIESLVDMLDDNKLYDTYGNLKKDLTIEVRKK